MTTLTDVQNALRVVQADLTAIQQTIAAAIAITPPSPSRYVASGAPDPSPQEIAAGLINVVFFDGFDDPSTVDLSYSWDDLKCNWFFAGYRPQSDALGSIASSITVSNSKLNLTRDYFDNAFGGILTSLSNPGSPNTSPPANWLPRGDWVGISFKGSQSITYAVSCDPGGAIGFPRSWPAGWRETREQQLQGLLEALAANGKGMPPPVMTSGHIEIDDFEWMPAGSVAPYFPTTLFSIRHWVESGMWPNTVWNWDKQQSIDSTFTSNPNGSAAIDLASTILVQTIYKSALDFGGKGSLQWFICQPGGVNAGKAFGGQWIHCVDCDVNWKTGDGSVWNLMDQQSHYILLGCGTNYPASFDYVCVRQLPGASLILG